MTAIYPIKNKLHTTLINSIDVVAIWDLGFGVCVLGMRTRVDGSPRDLTTGITWRHLTDITSTLPANPAGPGWLPPLDLRMS